MSDSIEMPLYTATWRGVLPIYKNVIQDHKGDSMIDNIAHHELIRMADAADMFGKFTRALQEVEQLLERSEEIHGNQHKANKQAKKIIADVLDEARETAMTVAERERREMEGRA